MSGTLRVFVYGTLKRGEPNHFWLTNKMNGYSKFLCNGCTINKYPLIIGTRYNIPFLLDKPGIGHHIKGEIYEINNEMLSKLDVLEDYPNYYDRELQNIKVDDNNFYSCWVYLMRKFPEELLNKKLLDCYTNTPELPYCERSKRDENIKPINDMKY